MARHTKSAAGSGVAAPDVRRYMLSARALNLLLLLAAMLSATADAAACTSGVLQIVPLPSSVQYDACMAPDTHWNSVSADADWNSIKALCGAAFRATTVNNVIHLVPLDTGSYVTIISMPESIRVEAPKAFNCKDLNASGLLDAASATSATVMLYQDAGGPLSTLTKTGPSQVALMTPISRNNPINFGKACNFTYTVVSGCVLGAEAPSGPPAPCTPGYVTRTGRFGIKYCAPCPKGTYSPGGAGATTCTPCAPGTASNRIAAAQCAPCARGRYAPKAGMHLCPTCAGSKWTDGKGRCEACPKGSSPSLSNRRQCVRCYAGKKCCTINWDKTCPKCTSTAPPKAYSSIFALESTTPASCLASNFALCSPKIKITIDGACRIIVSNLNNRNTHSDTIKCPWQSSVGIQGAAANAVRDIVEVGLVSKGATPALGNVTRATAPYLDITVPTPKCTLRYRALTKPAAAILGVAPKAAFKAPCPVGKYIDTSTDTKPGPCLPCPPGTYSTKPGTTGACIPCPPGTYASKYGSTKCTKCPPARAAKGGAASCSTLCFFNTYVNPMQSGCLPCPKNSYMLYPAAGACLSISYGSICCAAGWCGTQARCKGPLAPPKDVPLGTDRNPGTHASFRLKSRSVSSPACRQVPLFTCLPMGGNILISTSATRKLEITLRASWLNTCSSNESGIGSKTYYGSIAAANRARLGVPPNDVSVNTVLELLALELLSDAASRTLTMYLATQNFTTNPATLVTGVPAIRKECSATFELVSGYFLDIKPPAAATCPEGALPTQVPGRTLCQFCGATSGRVPSADMKTCRVCPNFQPDFDGVKCLPCLQGYDCGFGGSRACRPGTYGPTENAKPAGCRSCAIGTFSSSPGSLNCTTCPAGTVAPIEGSTVCGVPWQTQFPGQ